MHIDYYLNVIHRGSVHQNRSLTHYLVRMIVGLSCMLPFALIDSFGQSLLSKSRFISVFFDFDVILMTCVCMGKFCPLLIQERETNLDLLKLSSMPFEDLVNGMFTSRMFIIFEMLIIQLPLMIILKAMGVVNFFQILEIFFFLGCWLCFAGALATLCSASYSRISDSAIITCAIMMIVNSVLWITPGLHDPIGGILGVLDKTSSPLLSAFLYIGVTPILLKVAARRLAVPPVGLLALLQRSKKEKYEDEMLEEQKIELPRFKTDAFTERETYCYRPWTIGTADSDVYKHPYRWGAIVIGLIPICLTVLPQNLLVILNFLPVALTLLVGYFYLTGPVIRSFTDDFHDGTLPLLYILPMPVDQLLRKKLYALCGLAAHLIVSIGVTGLWLNVFFFFTFPEAAIYAQATFGLSALMIIYVLNSATVAMSVQDQPYVFSLLLNLMITLLYALILKFNIFVGIALICFSWALCLKRYQKIAAH